MGFVFFQRAGVVANFINFLHSFGWHRVFVNEFFFFFFDEFVAFEGPFSNVRNLWFGILVQFLLFFRKELLQFFLGQSGHFAPCRASSNDAATHDTSSLAAPLAPQVKGVEVVSTHFYYWTLRSLFHFFHAFSQILIKPLFFRKFEHLISKF
jgi:hypothetical protein